MPNFKIYYEINMIYKNRANIIFEQPKNPLNGSIKAHMDIANHISWQRFFTGQISE